MNAVKKHWQLYILILPVILYFIIFEYLPMYGVVIAFKSFTPAKGIFGSSWVGFKYFIRFFESYSFWNIIQNTLGISFYQLIIGFPAPILLALMMNEVNHTYFKKTVQTVTYAPHFLSTVVLAGLVVTFLSPKNGIVNMILNSIGMEPVSFMTEESWFKTIYVFSGIWQNTGWGSIIYMAALMGISPELYEAAVIDGASKLQRIRHVTLPGILPMAVMLLILETGKVMNVGFQKTFLLQNDLNIRSSEVIATYVYKTGVLGAEYSYSTAIDLFNSLVNVLLLLIVNKIAKNVTETGLW